jgi:nitroreductase
MTTTQVNFTSSVELARLAPSVHNTQPWRFRVEGETLVLSCDPGRRLRALDPSGRQQAISVGAALHLARLDLRLQGFDAVVDYGPFDGRPDDLAIVRPVPGHDVTTQDVVAWRAARSRHTQRERFATRPVEPHVVAALRATAEAHGAWVRVVGPDELPSLAVLLSHAEDTEQDDPAYQAELAEWTQRPPQAHDGLPSEATVDVGLRASTVRLRDFAPAGGSGTGPRTVGPVEPPPAEHPLTMVVGTEADRVVDWLHAGEALMDLWLRATVDGVQASPLGQVIDLEWTRDRLGAELGVVGHPQMVLRLGYAQPGPDTPRRPVSEVLG